MKVRDLMTSAKLATARPEDALPLAAQMMVWSNVRHLPVVRDGQVVGVVSQRDLLGHINLDKANGGPTTVQDVMHTPAITVAADAPLAAAVSLMFENKLGCLPVLGQGTLVGIVTTTDLLRHLLATAFARPTARPARTVRAFMKPIPQGVSATTELFDSAGLIVRADAPLASAVAELLTQSVGVLPVVGDDGTLVGTLSYPDLIRALRDERDVEVTS